MLPIRRVIMNKYQKINSWALFVRPAPLDIEPPALEFKLVERNSQRRRQFLPVPKISGIVREVYQTATDPDVWLVKTVSDFFDAARDESTYMIDMKEINIDNAEHKPLSAVTGIFNCPLSPEHLERFENADPRIKRFAEEYINHLSAKQEEMEAEEKEGFVKYAPESGKKAKIVFDKEIRVTRNERDWRWMA